MAARFLLLREHNKKVIRNGDFFCGITISTFLIWIFFVVVTLYIYLKFYKMTEEKKVSAAEKMLGDFAPRLLDYTDNVLFGDVWEGKELSRRERSLITVAALVAGEHSNQLNFHLNYAKQHGLTEAELVEVITHLAFYVGWPKAMTAIMIAKEAFKQDKS
ncbi:carboxymuconolactone decarboxylase family protein [Aquirufa nivalisilvae]|uniref:carboxymuconolactone decarboxylase family protein n=1 Tax=Aquirufa nivalisilvae TaxID=2516557 RepID=UPI001E4AE14E|nr:carboxymuconolactone decarboxylase family protein [Aquirufa nivalisilvae]